MPDRLEFIDQLRHIRYRLRIKAADIRDALHLSDILRATEQLFLVLAVSATVGSYIPLVESANFSSTFVNLAKSPVFLVILSSSLAVGVATYVAVKYTTRRRYFRENLLSLKADVAQSYIAAISASDLSPRHSGGR